MKKCPQCGTILEETKKKCYMCGAELEKRSFALDFGDTFDEQIGATVTNGQNNAFNNVGNVMDGAEGTISNNANQVTFANSMNAVEEVQESVANMPSKYDNRTAIEKIFSTDARYRQDALEFNGNTQDDFSNNPQCFESAPMVPLPPTNNQEEEDNNKKKKPAINWGSNLKNSYSEEEHSGGKKITFATIFNIFSVIVFLVCVIFLYFKFVAKDEKPAIEQFGGLSYEISPDFVLESEAGRARYYTYGSACALKISYGPTVETTGFLDSYFEQVKEANKNSQTTVTEMGINGNSWTEIRVFNFEQNAASQNGYAEVLRYQYVAIIHRGNFYDIVFANDNNDGRCKSMFDQFMNSVRLD